MAELAIAAAGSREAAAECSKNRFNRARRSLERLEVPTADTIRQRLRRPWEQVVRASLAPAGERGKILSQGHGRHAEFEGPEELVLTGLRSVCSTLEGVVTFDAYDAEVGHRNRRRARSKLAPLPLLSATSLVKRYGSWPQVLEAAGVKEADDAYVVSPRIARLPAAEETMSALVDELGILPAGSYLENYCRAMDIPLGRDARPFGQLMARVRALRASEGKPTPAEVTPPRLCPPLPTPVGRTAATRRIRRRSLEEVLASLRLYRDEYLQTGAHPAERHYRACRRLDRRLISLKSFPEGRRFQELCREAGL